MIRMKNIKILVTGGVGLLVPILAGSWNQAGEDCFGAARSAYIPEDVEFACGNLNDKEYCP